MVIQELIRVIQASIENMKRYPKLRHEIESVMCNFIRETEQICKEHVILITIIITILITILIIILIIILRSKC